MLEPKDDMRGRALRTAACMTAILIAAALFYRCGMSYDVLFMARHGADILDGNLDRTYDFLSLHEWLPFSHQKWAACLLSYFIMGSAGLDGFHFAAMALFALTGFAAFFVSNALWPRGDGHPRLFPALALMAGLDSPMLMQFRPHCVGGLILLAECFILERYASGRLRPKILYPAMAACSFLAMWVHSTMWPAYLIPLLPYVAECRFIEKMSRGALKSSGYDKRPLFLAAISMLLAACANPNGIGQFRYLLLCAEASDPSVLWHVGEVQPLLSPASGVKPVFIMIWIGWMALSGIIIFRDGRRARDVFFWIGSLAMLFGAARCAYYAILFTWFAAMGRLCHDLDKIKARRAAGIAMCCAAVLIMGIEYYTAQPHGGTFRSAWDRDGYIYREAEKAYAAIEQDSGGQPAAFLADAMAVYEPLTYMGLRPFIDCRAELYIAEDASGVSVLDGLREYMYGTGWDGLDFNSGGTEAFLRYYGIDYIAVLSGYRDLSGGSGLAIMDGVPDCCGILWQDDFLTVYKFLR